MESNMCFRAICVLVVLLAFSADGQNDGCPIHFWKHTESCYHVFANPTLKWWEAMAFCAMYGHGDGTLATIESEDEELFLESLIKNQSGNFLGDFWLGANDLVKEGTWVWVKRNEYVSEYTSWAPGEPSSGNSENCLAIYAGVNYKWNDAPCSLAQAFICEVPYIGQPSEIVG